MSARLGGGGGLLAVGWLSSILSSALAAWAGTAIAAQMPPEGKTMFVAAALALAGLELVWPMRKAPPEEPTRSLGAIAIVLFAGQITDAARFLILAIGVATANWPLAAAGGALGSAAVLTVAWTLGAEWETRLPLRAIRSGAGYAVRCGCGLRRHDGTQTDRLRRLQNPHMIRKPIILSCVMEARQDRRFHYGPQG